MVVQGAPLAHSAPQRTASQTRSTLAGRDTKGLRRLKSDHVTPKGPLPVTNIGDVPALHFVFSLSGKKSRHGILTSSYK